jgi:hypothetical protein
MVMVRRAAVTGARQRERARQQEERSKNASLWPWYPQPNVPYWLNIPTAIALSLDVALIEFEIL